MLYWIYLSICFYWFYCPYFISSYEAEWAERINEDGSVFYVESYVSSAVREKQEQAMKSQPEKKNTFANEKQLKKQSKLIIF